MPPLCTCHKTLVLAWELTGALPRACPMPPDAEHSCTAPAPAMSVGHPLVSAHDLEALGCGTCEACKGGCAWVLLQGRCTTVVGAAGMGDQARPLINWCLMQSSWLLACLSLPSVSILFKWLKPHHTPDRGTRAQRHV